jgi:hypothetical protein
MFQIQIATAKSLGFTGTKKELDNPFTNYFFAEKLLEKLYTKYKGNLDLTLVAWNGGEKVADRIKHPRKCYEIYSETTGKFKKSVGCYVNSIYKYIKDNSYCAMNLLFTTSIYVSKSLNHGIVYTKHRNIRQHSQFRGKVVTFSQQLNLNLPRGLQIVSDLPPFHVFQTDLSRNHTYSAKHFDYVDLNAFQLHFSPKLASVAPSATKHVGGPILFDL